MEKVKTKFIKHISWFSFVPSCLRVSNQFFVCIIDAFY